MKGIETFTALNDSGATGTKDGSLEEVSRLKGIETYLRTVFSSCCCRRGLEEVSRLKGIET